MPQKNKEKFCTRAMHDLSMLSVWQELFTGNRIKVQGIRVGRLQRQTQQMARDR